MGHVLEHVAIELQNVAGEPVTFGKTRVARRRRPVPRRLPVRAGGRRPRGGPARRHAAPFAPAARSCGPRARCPPTSTSPPSGTSSSASPSAARSGPARCRWCARPRSGDIPWIRLNEQSLIQFGHGRYQQRIQATVTSRTPHIAVELASDKEETNRILGQPRPAGAAAAAGAARGRRGGRGGADRLPGGGEAVQRATTAAASRSTSPTADAGARRRSRWRGEHSRSVIVESFITGDDHRMLVVNGELIAVSKRVPGHVVGDGVAHDRAAGREGEPRIPRRGIGHEKVLTRLGLRPPGRDDAGARRATRRRRCRPAGELVFLRSTGNLSTGGTADRRHRRGPPRQRRDGGAGGEGDRARRRRRGLPHRPTSPSPTRRVGGAICEVNAAPGFRMHMAPSEGRAARRGRAGDGHAVPAGHAEPDPDRRDHRHQRQDHDRAHAGAHPQAGRPPRRAHHHRRRVHRRPAHGRGRHDRPGRDPHGAERPAGGRGGARDGARRPAPRRHGRPPLRRRRRAQREGGPPGPARASARWSSWRR